MTVGCTRRIIQILQQPQCTERTYTSDVIYDTGIPPPSHDVRYQDQLQECHLQ
jgi:hypothetical protein